MIEVRCAVVLAALSACGGDPVPAFPANYAASFVEVRDCRASADHDLMRIKVLADPSSAAAYQQRDRPFPDGGVVLKAEYDFSDMDCTGDVVQWTVMESLPEGSAPDTGDWHWQKVDVTRKVVSENDERCITCHMACGGPPDGYRGTCTVP